MSALHDCTVLCIGDEIALQTLPTEMDYGDLCMAGFVAARQHGLKCDYTEVGQAPSQKRHCHFIITTPHQFTEANRLDRYLASDAHRAAVRPQAEVENWTQREDRALEEMMEKLGMPMIDADADADDMWQAVGQAIQSNRTPHELKTHWERRRHEKLIEELEVEKQKEEKRNVMKYEMSKGDPVQFGKVYQLLSLQFYQFVRTDAAIADEDDRALVCSLADQSHRSRMCWFRFKPGFDCRHEGDAIRAGDTVVVESVHNVGMFLHCEGGKDEEIDDESVDYGELESLREVNASQRPTRLTVVQVASHMERVVPNSVRGGSFVQIQQRSSNRYVCCDHGQTRPRMQPERNLSLASARANRIWQVDKPTNNMSGGNVVIQPEMVFNLKFAVSGEVLCANMSKCALEEHNEKVAHQQCAQWQAVPFDPDTDHFEYNRTSFILKNVETKRFLAQDGDELSTIALDELDTVERHLLVFKPVPGEWLHEFLGVLNDMSKIWKFKHDLDTAREERENHGPIAIAADMLGITRERLHMAEFKRCTHWAKMLNEAAQLVGMEELEIKNNKDDLQETIKDFVHPGAFATVISKHLRQAGRGRSLDTCAGPVLVTLQNFLWNITTSETGVSIAAATNLSASQLLERDGLVNRQLQQMLCDFGCVPTLIGLLDSIFRTVPAQATSDGSHAIESDAFEQAHGPELVQTVRYCYRMLQMLVRANGEHTRDLVVDVEHLLQGKSKLMPDSSTQHVLRPYLTPQARGGFYSNSVNHTHQVSLKAADLILEILRTNIFNRASSQVLVHKGASVTDDQIGTATPRLSIDQNLVISIWEQVRAQRHPLYVELISSLLVGEASAGDESLGGGLYPIKENQDIVLAALRPDWDRYKVDFDPTVLADGELTSEHAFHVSLVNMAALLCMGRHRESISFFDEAFVDDDQPKAGFGFSYDAVLQVLKSGTNKYHDSARYVYARLMLHLFVDREPHETCVPIQFSRVSAREPSLPEHGCTEGMFVDLTDAIQQALKAGGASSELSSAVVIRGIEDRYENADLLQILFADHDLEPFISAKFRLRSHVQSYVVVELQNEEAVERVLTELTQDKHQLGVERYDPRKAAASKGMMAQLSGEIPLHAAQTDRNQFCIALVHLVQQLVLTGAYSTTASTTRHWNGVLELTEDGCQLGIMMVKMLDGSSDTVSSVAMQTAQAQGFSAKVAQYIMNPQNRIVMENKRAVLGVMKMLFQLRISTQISKLVHLCTSPFEPQAGQQDNPMYDNISFEVESASGDSESATIGEKCLSIVQEVRLFKESMDEKVNAVLLEVLQYEMADLAFASFEVLMFYHAQALVFYQSLQQILMMDSVDGANLVHVAHDYVSALIRLVPGLHRETDCRECTETIKTLRAQCTAEPIVSTVLRNYNLCDIICRILRMRLGTTYFATILRETLLLTGDFCRGNPDNQQLMASHVQDLVFPLLSDPLYSEESASCLCSILKNNTSTILALGDQVIEIVSRCSTGDNRHPGFIHVLQNLLVADKNIVSGMPMRVCTAMVDSGNELWQPDGGKVSANEWAAGPKVARVKMIEILLLGRIPDDSPEYKKRFNHTNKKLRLSEEGEDITKATLRRCSQEAAYYATSLEVLGDCAADEDQRIELLCAHRLSFVKVVKRLHELFNHPQCCAAYTNTRLDKTRIKHATMNFFREVFVNSSQAYMLKSLRSPANGIWVVNEDETSIEGCTPLGDSLLDDLKLLLPESELWCSTVEEDRTQTRRYLFTQVVRFFIDFAQAVPLRTFTPNEQLCIAKVYAGQSMGKEPHDMGVQHVVGAALEQLQLWEESEIVALQSLHSAAESFVAGTPPSESNIQACKQQVNVADVREPTLLEVPSQWTTTIEAVSELMRISSNSGSSVRGMSSFASSIAVSDSSLKGIGIMRVAEALWSEAKHLRGKHFSSFLAKALETRLDNVHDSRDDIKLISTILDVIRALPYVVGLYSEDQQMNAFCDFLEFKHLVAEDNPDVAQAQSVLISEGWGLLCFRVLSQEHYSALHLSALRLLRVLMRDANSDAKDKLLSQLDNPVHCPVELCVSTVRRVLQADLSARSMHRTTSSTKASIAALVPSDRSQQVDTSGSPSNENETVRLEHESDDTGLFMLEALWCVRAMASGHPGMQMYLEWQPGHASQLSIIAYIVDHITDLEDDLMDAIDARNVKLSKVQRRKAELTLEQMKAGLEALVALSIGPLPENQEAIARTDIPAVLSRLLSRCIYVHRTCTAQGVVKTSFCPMAVLNTKKKLGAFHLCRQITHLLQTLLDGTPQPKIVAILVDSLPWTALDRHLRDLKDMMEATNVDGPLRLIKRESFKLMAIIDKCTHGTSGEQSVQSATLSRLLLSPVVSSFRGSQGVTQVVRNGLVEKLYFTYPEAFLDPIVTDEIESEMIQAMNSMPRDDTTSKLRAFLSAAFEIVAMVEHKARAKGTVAMLGYQIDRLLPGHSNAFSLSCLTTGICLLSYDHAAENRGSHDISAYGRVSRPQIAYYTFVALGIAHVLVCCLSFWFFVSIRVPVLRELRSRESRLSFFAAWQGEGSDRQQFIDRSVYLYGIADSFIEWKDKEKTRVHVNRIERKIKSAFSNHGCPVAAVKFKHIPGGTSSSWAVVSFGAAAHTASEDHPAIQHLKSTVRTKMTGTSQLQAVQLQEQTKKQSMLAVGIKFLDSEKVTAETKQLQSVLEEAWIDVCSQSVNPAERHTAQFLESVQALVNKLLPKDLGPKIPIADAFYLRNSSEFWAEIADIVFSVLGFVSSPLFFSFHLTHLARLESATIVMKSITANWKRLGNTLVLALMFIYMFAIAGLLFFRAYHVGATEGVSQNPEGPCASLLTCFISYVYAGLMQSGIGDYLSAPTFPEHTTEMFTRSFGLLTLETLFMLVTSTMLMSVITGIICDTFSELRAKADDAQAYRSSTCFITGVPYSSAPEEEGTRYMDYVALLLHGRNTQRSLKGKTESSGRSLQPLEEMVDQCMSRGDISWLPVGRSLSQEKKRKEEASLEHEVRSMYDDVRTMQPAISEIQTTISELSARVEAISGSVQSN